MPVATWSRGKPGWRGRDSGYAGFCGGVGMALLSKRSVMTLFSSPDHPDSHRVRIVLAEKGINYEVVYVDGNEMSEDLVDLNPYQTLPTLVDRELVLYDSRVIMEYLDERFPHPPLMPVDPVARARTRIAMVRLEKDWYSLADDIAGRSEKQRNKARKILRERLIAGSEVFAAQRYFLNPELSLADCTVIPILWRLRVWDLTLPASARPITDYATRMFRRPSVQASLSQVEATLGESRS